MKKILLCFSLFVFFLPAFSQWEDETKSKLTLAAEAMRGRRFLEAEQIYKSLLKTNPEDVSTKQLLCHALINEKKFIEADSMLRRMNEADTNNAGNYWYMGISAQKQLQDSITIICFKKYLQKTENNPNQLVKAWLYVGSAYRVMMHSKGINLRQFDDMLYHYNQYLQLNPTDPYADQLKQFVEQVTLKKPQSGAVLIWDEAK